MRVLSRRVALFAAVALMVPVGLLLESGTAQASTRCTVHSADRDGDGIPNCWEKRNGLAVGTRDARSDRDHDGMSARREFRVDVATKGNSIFQPFSANDSDSDDDGVEDGDENDGDHNDDDGDDNNDVSGTIVSFDSNAGALTVQPDGGGDPVTGTVTPDTEIEWSSDGCGDGEDATTGDLQPGTGVEEMEFNDDGTTLEKVELICPGSEDDDD
jgi:hypothetical protein